MKGQAFSVHGEYASLRHCLVCIQLLVLSPPPRKGPPFFASGVLPVYTRSIHMCGERTK